MSTSAAAYTPPADQPPPNATAGPYGGFWVRLAAHFVDGFIVSVSLSLIAMAASIGLAVAGFDDAIGPVLVLLAVGLPLFYHAGFVASARMATPGKRLCGLYVTDIEGHRLPFGRAAWRHVAASLSYLTLYIGFIMAGFTQRKQALHDMVAGTLVHRQPGGSAVVVIVVFVAAFLLVAVMGILAAIAIPAYQDYTIRAKVAGVMSAMSSAKAPVVEHMMNKGSWPTAWEQLGPDADPMRQVEEQTRNVVESIRLEAGGAIVAGVKVNRVQGELRLTPKRTSESTFEWTCTSSAGIRKYVAASCRQ